jgi:alkaline phosphatase
VNRLQQYIIGKIGKFKHEIDMEAHAYDRLYYMSEAEELKELCQPVVDWLKKNHDPHTEVHITAEHIDLMESVIGIPVK